MPRIREGRRCSFSSDGAARERVTVMLLRERRGVGGRFRVGENAREKVAESGLRVSKGLRWIVANPAWMDVGCARFRDARLSSRAR